MIVGTPREVKEDEYRVAMLPGSAEALVRDGHTVLIERKAGSGSGFEDEAYAAAGAELVDGPEELFQRAELIVKVKEPQPREIAMLRKGQLVFTFFHFAGSAELTEGCLRSGIVAVAYETLQDPGGKLPLLAPMSDVAGKVAVQEGARHLERTEGGRGILLGGVPGVPPGDVLVLGGGVAGTSAAHLAAGMGANVVVMDIDRDRLRFLDEAPPTNVSAVYSDPQTIRQYAASADLIIGAVLIPGGRAPMLLTREHLKSMKRGAVLVDIAIDQGGCFETSRPTTHHEPTYVVDGVIHYCVTNIPGAVPRTSSMALCNATLPYTRQLARLGADEFAALGPGHAAAINMRNGKLTHSGVIDTFPNLPRN